MEVKELNIDFKPMIKKLELGLKREKSQALLSSSWQSVFKGRGLEFDSYRRYFPSDDAKDIDWKASLRAQELLVKVLTEERNVTIFVMLDVSNSMIFTSTEKLKCEYAAELASTIAFGAIGANDNVGLCMFNEDIVKYIPPGQGRKQFYMITKSLSDPKKYGGKFNFVKAMKHVVNLIPKGSIIFVISDFIGLQKKWDKIFKTMSRKYEIICLMVRDPRDNELPEGTGQFVLADPYSDKNLLVDPSYITEAYAKYVQEQIDTFRETVKSQGADMLQLTTDKDFVYPFVKLLKTRQA